MLNEEKNRVLTQVGPGTPMGGLLRRYWMPIAGASEFTEEEAIKPIRLFGEDLVLYRDFGGRYGLIDRNCSHRRADLSYGFVEEHGLRCNYHGWLYGENGACLSQPYEDVAHPDSGARDRIRIKAYPVQEKGGMLWAYMGPQPAPLLPDYEAFGRPNGFVQIVISEIPCNWFQCQENSIDPVHFEWMHNNWGMRLKGKRGPYSSKHREIGFEEFEHGFTYKRVRGDASKEDDPLWNIGRVCLWPNSLYTGSHFEWRVPIDDANTLSICWTYTRVPRESEPYRQDVIPTWHGPIRDENGRWISSHIMNQDFVAWMGQGVVADRALENLGASDRGIAMIRKRYFDDLETIAAGGDPKGIIRDPARNHRIDLPNVYAKEMQEGMSLEEMRKDALRSRHLEDYIWQAGQPAEVKAAYLAAMGISP
jgi:5,5'-dehydrodivanillate O-demethylase